MTLASSLRHEDPDFPDPDDDISIPDPRDFVWSPLPRPGVKS